MTTAARRISVSERQARIGARHQLGAGAAARTPEEAAGSLVALHGTDPATVYLSVLARMGGAAETALAAVEDALYERRSLVRMLGMRRTVFVVDSALVPVVHASSTRAIAVNERRKLVRLLRDGGGWGEQWLSDVEQSVLVHLAQRGESTAAELGEVEPRLREQVVVSAGKPYEARQGVVTRILLVLAAEGQIVRTRPRGSWTSSQFRWALAPDTPELTVPEAQTELMRRWLAAFGPGTEADAKWWTGWTLTDVRRALAAVDAEPVALDDGTGYVLPGDTGPTPGSEPWAALLPALDPTAMGWQQRGFYLSEEHRSALFDRNGNIGPSVWWDGRIVGGWAQRRGGEVVWRPLTDIGVEARAAVDTAAARAGNLLADVRITPRIRTPLERELVA